MDKTPAVAKEISLDVVVDTMDNIIGNLMNNEVVGAMPYMKSLIGVFKVYRSYHDLRLLEKLSAFFEECKNLDVDDVNKFMNSQNEENIGKIFTDYIDRMDCDEKCVLMGKIYKLMIDERWTAESFYRIASTIRNCFYSDLVELKKFPIDDRLTDDGKIVESEVVQDLFVNGLLIDCGPDGGDLNEEGGEQYMVNKYGELIARVI